MAYQQHPDPAPGDWFDQNAPPPLPYPVSGGDASVPGQAGNPSGTPPPWLDPSTQGVFAPGSGWWNAPAQTDPDGKVWTWNAGTNKWEPQGAAPKPGGTDDPTTFGGGGGTPNPYPGFGATPTPYTSDPNAPVDTPLPAYVPPEWTGGDYVNPTEADLLAMPGYQTQLNAGLKARERSAAAQGTVLNGGTLQALDRYGQDVAQQGYQTLRNNTYDAYKTRYSQFQDKTGMDLAARTLNANESQTSYQNRATRYLNENNRTLSDYITNLNARRQAESDYWNRNLDLSGQGRR